MTLINLKFSPEMEELVLQGKKCCTTRDEPKGEAGDIFVVKNRVYRIIEIEEICILVFALFIQVVSFFQPDSHPWYMVWLPALVCLMVAMLCFITGLISIVMTARAKRAEMLKIPEKKE